jgi:hypothetical protein
MRKVYNAILVYPVFAVSMFVLFVCFLLSGPKTAWYDLRRVMEFIV